MIFIFPSPDGLISTIHLHSFQLSIYTHRPDPSYDPGIYRRAEWTKGKSQSPGLEKSRVRFTWLWASEIVILLQLLNDSNDSNPLRDDSKYKHWLYVGAREMSMLPRMDETRFLSSCSQRFGDFH